MLRTFEIKRFHAGSAERAPDSIAIEEPLAIHVLHWRKGASFTENLAVTMRTPGADRELAVGLLLTEGVIQGKADLVEVRSLGVQPSNEVLVELAQHVDFDTWRQQRNGFVSSSCGVCGKASAEQIQQSIPEFAPSNWRLPSAFIESLPGLLQNQQPAFDQTGSVHAAALISIAGELQVLFEDVGRHNALDKLIGHAVLADWLPLDRHVIFMSSRSSFELVQKAAMAGSQVLASVGGPSSLAVETARQFGLTLLCFVRSRRFNVYAGDWRLDL